MKILLDPGHGGHDPGAVGQGHEEEDITLAVCMALGTQLREKYSVLYTRDNDTYISPGGRLKMIRDYQPGLFISVHCNSALNPAATGMEVIYRDEYDLPLAQAIHDSLKLRTSLKSRGIKHDIVDLKRKLAVLGDLKVPACLVELGFISNPADLAILQDTGLMASALHEGIEHWIELVRVT